MQNWFNEISLLYSWKTFLPLDIQVPWSLNYCIFVKSFQLLRASIFIFTLLKYLKFLIISHLLLQIKRVNYTLRTLLEICNYLGTVKFLYWIFWFDIVQDQREYWFLWNLWHWIIHQNQFFLLLLWLSNDLNPIRF